MAHETHTEVERKYDVGPDSALPDLVGVGSVAALGPADEQRLDAEYYDTEGLHLARLGLALRRRQGGPDDGWHLKVPVGDGERTELRFPLGADGDPMPPDLWALVRGAARNHPVVPVARVLNERVERALQDAEGRSLALVTDDRVVAERSVPDPSVLTWREWEVELAGGDRQVLDSVESALLEAGATRAHFQSKMRRALGLDGDGPTVPSSPDWTVGQALAAYLAKYRDVLLLQEVGVRLGSPEAVHHVRTATRRLRSVLAAWRRHLADVDSAEHVRAELKWVGEALGRARDSYVLREHLDEVLDAEPPELVLGPVRTRVDDELAAEYRHGVEQALEAMSSERYFALMEALDRLVESPADPDRGAEPAADAMPKVLAREVKRVRRAEAAVPPVGEAGRDAALHELRKKAKRLRYAADAAKPVLRRPAKRLAKRAKRVQETLGGRQDAVVAAGRLRELAVQAYLAGENGFSFGRMHALEGNRADESERAFRAAWEKLPRRHVRASLRTD